ncbi:Pentatricopeptide repeat-containing protein [Rhynchospora pubera]|uniref:Pentatricopeptide repeat-containing protein n=1 Tax=Rhynchospora pubera TaxID=906938 RepID=A0AAV8G3R9_9POAL|nr:Pentatricopeptide repeat-containing protein [Rhynchospora pubera]
MMAIWSSDWSLAPLPPFCTSLTKIQPSISILYTSSIALLSKKQRVPLASFCTACSSPLLENHSPTELRRISLQPSPVTDITISNKLIRNLCEDPQTEAIAFEYYRKARDKQNFQPDSKTLTTLFRKLLNSKQWSSVGYLVEDLNSLNVLPDVPMCSSLVMGCIKARKFKLMESFLKVVEAKKGDVARAAFSSALRGYNKLHMYRSTILVYDRMRAAQLPLDSTCYLSTMEAYHAIRNLDMVISLFHDYKSNKFDSSNDAIEIYNILCNSLAKGDKPLEALRYMREMENEGLLPSSSIYSSLISSFAAKKEVEKVEDLFNEALEKQLVKDPDICQKLVVMYVEIGLLGKTIWVVKQMKAAGMKVSDCICSAIVNGFAKKRDLKASLRSFNELITIGCEPGQVTYASVVNVCCRLGLTSEAEALFSEMLEKGFDKCVVAYANMISMYGESGRASDAMQLLAKMKLKGCQPNLWVYNSLLDMFSRLMNVRRVEKLWKEMERRKIVPDKISHTSVIGAYSRAGDLNACIRLYRQFKANGGKVDRVLVGIMVGVFSRSSRYNDLIELLREMKREGTELDRRLYESVLNRLRDAELQVHVRWLENNFGFKGDKT